MYVDLSLLCSYFLTSYYMYLQSTAELLYAVLTARLKSTFHKINVHAAMTPTDIHSYFQPVFKQAKALRDAFERRAKMEQEAAASQAALNESKKRESLGRTTKPGPMASIRTLAMSSIVSVIHSSPSSSSIDSITSASSGSPGPTATLPVGGASIAAGLVYPPASHRTVPFVTVSALVMMS